MIGNTRFKSNIRIYADLILAATIRHDREFRKKHDCHCKHRVDYGGGDWYCEAMQKHRNKDPEIKKLMVEFFKTQQDTLKEQGIEITSYQENMFKES